jgi:two-component system response regulator FixJ
MRQNVDCPQSTGHLPRKVEGMMSGGTVFVVDARRVLDCVSGIRASLCDVRIRNPVPGELPRPRACLLLDVRMPDMDGLEVQRHMKERGIRISTIMLSGQADVALAVEAMKAGAIDFVEKPFDWKRLLKMVSDQIEHDTTSRSVDFQRSAIAALHETLTPRERQVAEQMVAGQPTKAIAAALGTAFNTVNNQRKSILRKMQADSVVDLTRMLMTLNAD